MSRGLSGCDGICGVRMLLTFSHFCNIDFLIIYVILCYYLVTAYDVRCWRFYVMFLACRMGVGNCFSGVALLNFVVRYGVYVCEGVVAG